MQSWTLPSSYEQRRINTPPGLLGSICPKLHFPWSQDTMFLSTIDNRVDNCGITSSFFFSLINLCNFESFPIKRQGSSVTELSWNLDFFSLSSSSSLHPLPLLLPPANPHITPILLHHHLCPLQPFSWRALMHRKARVHSISHPIAINLSPCARTNGLQEITDRGGAKR